MSRTCSAERSNFVISVSVQKYPLRGRSPFPIPENVLSSLKAHRTRQLEEKLQAGADWHERGLVFTSSKGTPLYARNVIRSFHRLLAKAKVRRCRFHDLRNSCATFLLAKNVPARVVMEILGHSNISLTINTYSHVIPEMLRDAAEAMNTFIAEPMSPNPTGLLSALLSNRS